MSALHRAEAEQLEQSRSKSEHLQFLVSDTCMNYCKILSYVVICARRVIAETLLAFIVVNGKSFICIRRDFCTCCGVGTFERLLTRGWILDGLLSRLL